MKGGWEDDGGRDRGGGGVRGGGRATTITNISDELTFSQLKAPHRPPFTHPCEDDSILK